MGQYRISLTGRVVLGLVLLGASSCAPVKTQGSRIAQAVPPSTPRQLLRDLALDVPGDLPGLAGLPATLRAAVAEDAAPASVAAAPPFLAQMQSSDDGARAADCLTAAVYYEARSEPLDGQRAVAQVVLNRVRDRAFPASVCGVVYQGGARRDGRGIGCQFSFACDGSTFMSRIRVIAPTASLVWTVDRTRWPVSDACTAISAVSRSRISPMRQTSGS